MTAPEHLAARAEISDLLVDYCRLLDRMDLAALAALFTTDCDVRYGADPRLAATGRAALERSLARMWRWSRTAHHLANVRIWIDGAGAARAESAVWAWHEAPDGTTAEVFGRYLDALRIEDGAWRIASRRMEQTGTRGAFAVPVPPAHRAPPPPGWTPPVGLDG